MSGRVGAIKTFSVGFAEKKRRLDYARLVAKRLTTDHNEIVVNSARMSLPYRASLARRRASAHSAQARCIFGLTRRQTRQGGVNGKGVTKCSQDTMLPKNVYNRVWRTLSHWCLRTPNSIERSIQKLPNGSVVKRKLTRTFLCLSPDIESLYFDNFGVFRRGVQPNLLTLSAQDRIGAIEPYAGVQALLEQSDASTLLNQLLYADTKRNLSELYKADQNDLAASVEPGSSPFSNLSN